MRRRAEFTTAVEHGRRGRSARLVVHLASGPDTPGSDTQPPTVGFVVPRSVGDAVDRNLVRRRLRALMSERLRDLPAGARVVVRALPASAGTPSPVLGQDLDRALRSAATSGGRRRTTS